MVVVMAGPRHPIDRMVAAIADVGSLQGRLADFMSRADPISPGASIARRCVSMMRIALGSANQ